MGGMSNSYSELRTVLARVPGGDDAVARMTALGLFSPGVHQRAPGREFPPGSFSDLPNGELSDHVARLAADLGRFMEAGGLLRGLLVLLSAAAKEYEADARRRARAGWPADAKPPTIQQIDDAAAADPAVRDAHRHVALVESLLKMVLSAEESTAAFHQAASREITFRVAQLDARIGV